MMERRGGRIRRFLLIYSFVTFIVHSSLSAQATALVGAGYANPTDIRVSPGQITTIFVSGLTVDPSKPQKATNLPLPNSLAGISVTMNQSSPKQSLVVPLLAVSQLSNCSNGGGPPSPTLPSDCLITAIMLQVPYELSPLHDAEVVITSNGIASKAFAISAITDNFHVLNTSDLFSSSFSLQGSFSKCNVDTVRCTGSSVVSHADGTLVTATAPAKPGEVVVIYAFGLGQTIPAVKAGEATPTPAPVLGGSRIVALQFDFGTNKGPSNPLQPTHSDPFLPPNPSFVGLTPGQVGLYQINVQLPSTFPAILPCGTLVDFLTGQTITVQSNLTIDIGGVGSFDGAAVCVYVPVAVGPLPHENGR